MKPTPRDPLRATMVHLLKLAGFTEWEREEAIYAFASDHHSGQFSNLYAALCTSPFKPGPLWKGPSDERTQEAYETLQLAYV